MDGAQGLFSGLRTSSTGLAAERTRIDVIARNIANANTTSTPEGGPYCRQVVRFEPLLRKVEGGGTEILGVRVADVEPDRTTPFEEVYDPSHPDADENGMVLLPNVNATREMADMITAVRAYEANLSAQESFVRMAERALRMAQ
jgi:flagellar basal-body rod protein FlgC